MLRTLLAIRSRLCCMALFPLNFHSTFILLTWRHSNSKWLATDIKVSMMTIGWPKVDSHWTNNKTWSGPSWPMMTMMVPSEWPYAYIPINYAIYGSVSSHEKNWNVLPSNIYQNALHSPSPSFLFARFETMENRRLLGFWLAMPLIT